MTNNIVCWNTDRPYTNNGQRISATLIDGNIYFSDIDRSIAGEIVASPFTLHQIENEIDTAYKSAVMPAYDTGEFKDLEWGSDIRKTLDLNTLNTYPNK